MTEAAAKGLEEEVAAAGLEAAGVEDYAAVGSVVGGWVAAAEAGKGHSQGGGLGGLGGEGLGGLGGGDLALQPADCRRGSDLLLAVTTVCCRSCSYFRSYYSHG